MNMPDNETPVNTLKLVMPAPDATWKQEYMAQFAEENGVELIEPAPVPEDKKPTKKKPELKYISVTGYFNRVHKRELAERINKNKRREIHMLVCGICRLAYMGKVNRCQCAVSKLQRAEVK